jgi:O-antigen/teichoic acid export membrane protein
MMRLAGMGASLLLGILLARYLQPSEFGVYGIFMSLALLLSVAGRIGFPNLATREIAIAVHRAEWTLAKGVIHWFGRAVVLLSFSTAAIFILGVWLWAPGTSSIWSGPAIWAAALIPLFALGALVGAELRGLDHLVAGQSLDSFVRPTLTCLLCVGAIFIWQGMTPAAALCLNAIASALTLGLGWIFLRLWMPQPLMRAHPERHGRRWGKSSLMLGAVDGLRQLDANQGLIILGALTQTLQAGYLRVALSAMVFVILPQTVVHLVAAPTLARLSTSKKTEELQRILTRSSQSLFLITFAFLLVLAAAGLPLIKLMFGEAYEPAWVPLLLLSFAQLINATFGLGWVLMTMAGGERQLGQYYAISVGLGIAAGIPLCLVYGATGAALATILSTAVQNVLVWRYVRTYHSADCAFLLGPKVAAR